MENREKIIQLLENKWITGYSIEIMSNGRMYSANFRRYKNRARFEENPFDIFNSMSEKVERLLLELAEEVLRVNPQTKGEVSQMIHEYSMKKHFDG
ncbi:hypothetical protein ACIJEF_002490 [Enterococcus faecalis]